MFTYIAQMDRSIKENALQKNLESLKKQLYKHGIVMYYTDTEMFDFHLSAVVEANFNVIELIKLYGYTIKLSTYQMCVFTLIESKRQELLRSDNLKNLIDNLTDKKE